MWAMWWLFSFTFHVSGSCVVCVPGKTLHARVALTTLYFFQGCCQPFRSWLFVFARSGPLIWTVSRLFKEESLCFSPQFIAIFWYCCHKAFLGFHTHIHLFLSSSRVSSVLLRLVFSVWVRNGFLYVGGGSKSHVFLMVICGKEKEVESFEFLG